MPKINVNKKRGVNARVDLETFWNDNVNLENPFNTLLPITWGTDIGHVVSEMPSKERDLFIPIGKNEKGYFTFDLSIGRHILAGGSMLSGVGMFRRVTLLSLIKTHTPETLRVILIDPKGLMSSFDDIPHLQFPRAKTAEDIIKAIKWCNVERNKRFKILEKSKTVSVGHYNKHKAAGDPVIPSIVIFISELGDLIDIPNFDTRLYSIASMTRATSMHFVITTQQPSVSVVTPIIQETFCYRIAFQMPYEAESKMFVGQAGAEELLGQGDMLFKIYSNKEAIHLQGLYHPLL